MNLIYIIGDGFFEFANKKDIYTYSQIIKRIANLDLDNIQQSICILGQGLSSEERLNLIKLSRANKIGMLFNSYQKYASSAQTHKHKHSNIMITDPLIVAKDKIYRSYLVVDDGCAEMSDHITGQHIQGMVLTEAARQMMLAVAEKYVLKLDEKGNSYCALIKVASEFYRFAFPVDIRIEHEIINLNKVSGKGYDVKTNTQFIQANEVIASIDIDYKFYKKELLEKIEKKLAEKTAQADIAIRSQLISTDIAA